MATVHRNGKTALIIVDAQVGVLEGAHRPQEVVAALNTVVTRARAAGVPVVWVQHEDDELVAQTPAWQLAPGLSPRADETLLGKRHNSCFEETDLEARLAALGVSHLVLGGAATNWCIRATAYGALERGYDLTLVADGHTTSSLELGPGRRVEAADLIDDLNAVIQWVSYPGRTNRSLPSAEITFTPR